VPDAVPPALQDEVIDDPVVFVFMPPPSKVDGAPLPEIPPAQTLVFVVVSDGAGLRPPGDNSVDPREIPAGPTGDAEPGTPSGDAPMIAPADNGAAICATPALQLRASTPSAKSRVRVVCGAGLMRSSVDSRAA
jgi:hypothetical protein